MDWPSWCIGVMTGIGAVWAVRGITRFTAAPKEGGFEVAVVGDERVSRVDAQWVADIAGRAQYVVEVEAHDGEMILVGTDTETATIHINNSRGEVE